MYSVALSIKYNKKCMNVVKKFLNYVGVVFVVIVVNTSMNR